jgi:prepilin-type N-terminal cleavage/methylation domain-containing protein
MWSSRHRSGYTLIEVMVVIVILTVLMSGIALPIAAQLQMRRQGEARRQFDDAKEALLGFVAAYGRLPCPATEASHGEEGFAVGGDASNGNCERFYDGWLPAATLGLAPLDADGFLRDPWASPRNRVRYAVYGGDVNGVASALTRSNGLQSATLAGVGAASRYIMICSAGAPATGTTCGPAANQLTRRAAFVLLSLGPNAQSDPPAGSDESRNVAGNPVFVYHENYEGRDASFDDLVDWVPVHIVASRLLAAGRLP